MGPGSLLEDISYVWPDPPSALLCKYSAFMSGHIIHISHVCTNSTEPPLAPFPGIWAMHCLKKKGGRDTAVAQIPYVRVQTHGLKHDLFGGTNYFLSCRFLFCCAGHTF